MENITYSNIWTYEVKSLRRQTDSIKEAHKVLHDHVMSLPFDFPSEEFSKLSEALASIYSAQFCLQIDVEHIEQRTKHELS